MAARLALIAACALVITTPGSARWLNEKTCLASAVIRINTAISPEASGKRGATFLTTVDSSFGLCRRHCCRTAECDVALYYRETRKCYLMKCGIPNLCVYVSGRGFAVVEFHKDKVDPSSLENRQEHELHEKSRLMSSAKDVTTPKKINAGERNDAKSSMENLSTVPSATAPHQKAIMSPKKMESEQTGRLPEQRINSKHRATDDDKSMKAFNSTKIVGGKEKNYHSTHGKTADSHNLINNKTRQLNDSQKLDTSVSETSTKMKHVASSNLVKLEAVYSQMKTTVTRLRMAVTILSVSLVLSLLFSLFVTCRAKIVISRLTPPDVLKLPTRGEESDYLINGIYS